MIASSSAVACELPALTVGHGDLQTEDSDGGRLEQGDEESSLGDIPGEETPEPFDPVAYSYIWIANSEQGTISKLDTRNLNEEARYLVRPDGGGSPSRTSVGLSGDVVVASRLGGVTKIYAHPSDCVDRNENGRIDTSIGPDDILKWGEDECIAWYTPKVAVSQRAIAWDLGRVDPDEGTRERFRVFSSFVRPGGLDGNAVFLELLDAETGDLLYNSGAQWDLGVGGYGWGLYGAAVDEHGVFWSSFLQYFGEPEVNHLLRIEFEEEKADGEIEVVSHNVRRFELPGTEHYGMTVDRYSRPWVCGYSQVHMFDPETETFYSSSGTVPYQDLIFRGCMTDFDHELIWVAEGHNLHAFNVKERLDNDVIPYVRTMSLVGEVEELWGVSPDVDGNIWAIERGNVAVRVNPENRIYHVYDKLTGAYTYSDMTGHALRSLIP